MVQGLGGGLGAAFRCRCFGLFSLVLLRKPLVIERSFEYNDSMEFGDSTNTEREQRTPLDAALDALNKLSPT